jgi:hypothetical protein
MSKIKVNSIEAATGSTITIPSGQTLDISSTTLTLPSTVVTTTGSQTLTNKTIGVSQLSGTLPVANGGTGLTTLGSASQVLRVNSGATALEFATAPSGKVLQAITATDSTQRNTSSTSFVTASNTLSVTITPASASNKIFLIASGNLYHSTGQYYAIATIFRDATDLGAASSKGLTQMYTPSGSDAASSMCMTILDSPNTTSAITYQVYFRTSNSSYSAEINQNNTKASITAFEIGA